MYHHTDCTDSAMCDESDSWTCTELPDYDENVRLRREHSRYAKICTMAVAEFEGWQNEHCSITSKGWMRKMGEIPTESRNWLLLDRALKRDVKSAAKFLSEL